MAEERERLAEFEDKGFVKEIESTSIFQPLYG
ncbi:hypothetical protein VTH82DRAFT_2458 [Thermothelomyces myriococcoides]